MTCSTCISFYGQSSASGSKHQNLRGQNTFITGCTNKRITTITDHESSNVHIKAVESVKAKTSTQADVLKSKSGQALLSLKSAERHRISNLFRNAHAVAKNNRPLKDYEWLCSIDKAKSLDVGDTYLNDQAALDFISHILGTETSKTVSLLNSAKWFSILMDGSTDISGDEQESLYIRTAQGGIVTERFLSIGSPHSTSSKDLYDYVDAKLKDLGIDKSKLVGMGSDGPSNMVGAETGLATLLRQDVGEDLINIHCFCHRLELSFRDVMKQNKLYDKLMTLLIGLHYFYKKQYKNKSGLLRTFKALEVDGVLPPKVTGTRWLPHLQNGIKGLMRSFRAFEAHLSTLSHTNAKAEGLLKIMFDKGVMSFVLFLRSVLDPLMKLSLKLQSKDITLADSLLWIESTADLIDDVKARDNKDLSELLASGRFQDIALRGRIPTMSYTEDIISGLTSAMRRRFELSKDNLSTVNATKILSISHWPVGDDDKFREFGEEEITTVTSHFAARLRQVDPDFNQEEVLSEWRLAKKVLFKSFLVSLLKFGTNLTDKTWKDVSDKDFPKLMLVVDILLSLPPTSVSCETSFSQMKLVKTSRRTRLNNNSLNSLLVVKLNSPDIKEFDPEEAVERWLIQAAKPRGHRRLNYSRKPANTTVNYSSAVIEIEADQTETESVVQPEVTESINVIDDIQEDVDILNTMFYKDDNDSDYCSDYQEEEDNLQKIMHFLRYE